MSKTTQNLWVLVFSVFFISATFGGIVVASYFQYWHSGEAANRGENGKSGAQPARRAPAALVRTAEAEWHELGEFRSLAGRLTQVKDGTVSSEVTGIIREMPVEVGSPVVGGQTLIARVDDTWTRLALEQAENQIKSLKIKLDFEIIELKRLSALARDYTISESDFLSQQLKADELKANLALAEVAKKEAEQRLMRTTITAPFDGYVVRKAAEIGDMLSPGSTIVEIISSGLIYAVINVQESHIDRLKIGDEITLFVEPLNAKTVGKVHSIVPQAATAARYFPVYILLDDENGRFKAGMSVTALISTTDPTPGIVVPKDGVITKPDGLTIWVITDQPSEEGPPKTIAEPIPVKQIAQVVDIISVKPETERGNEILLPGAKIVVEGGERLMPNQTVQIIETREDWFKDLPTGSGHTVISPKQRIEGRAM